MKNFFFSLRCLFLLSALLPAFAQQSPSAQQGGPFSILPVKEMRLYIHLSEALQNGYTLEDNDGVFGNGSNMHASYVPGSYIKDFWGYNSSVWAVENPFSSTGRSISIVFNGTNGFMDIMADIQTGITGFLMSFTYPIRKKISPTMYVVPQLQKSAKNIQPLLNTYAVSDPNNPPYITGHSLGGGMAQAAYMERGEQHKNARLFIVNPMGLPKSQIDNKIRSKTYDPNVTIIINGKEIVQHLNSFAYLDHVGGNLYFLPPSYFSCISEHSIDKTIDKMRLILATKEMMLKPCKECGEQAKEMDAASYVMQVFIPAWLQVNKTLIQITDEESARTHLEELKENVHRLNEVLQHSKSGVIKSAEQHGPEEQKAQLLFYSVKLQFDRAYGSLQANNFYNNAELKAILKSLE